jgi:hypothetical protein
MRVAGALATARPEAERTAPPKTSWARLAPLLRAGGAVKSWVSLLW